MRRLGFPMITLLMCALRCLVSTPGVEAQTVSVRLVNGASSNEGRVEVYYQGQWGTICDDHWNLEDGNVVCRMLGLPPATHAWGNAHFGQGSGPIILDDVSCYGFEYSIADCQHEGWFSNDCSHSEDAGVVCGEAVGTPSPLSVSLVGGRSHEEGRVEVCYRGQCGTVCDDGWDLDDANVVCRMLGLPPATHAWSNAHFGQGSGPIALYDVNCYGHEYSIGDCQHKGWFRNVCGHSEDAGVTCGVAITSPAPGDFFRLSGSSPSQGTVQVWSNGQYSDLCSDEWDHNAAKVVCRQEGYPTNAVYVVYNTKYLGPFHAYSLSCSGYEHDLSQCATPTTSHTSTCRTAKVNCRPYPGLSTGAVIGISVASAVTVIFIVIIVVIALARRRRRKPSQTSNMNMPFATAAQPPATDPRYSGE